MKNRRTISSVPHNVPPVQQHYFAHQETDKMHDNNVTSLTETADNVNKQEQ